MLVRVNLVVGLRHPRAHSLIPGCGLRIKPAIVMRWRVAVCARLHRLCAPQGGNRLAVSPDDSRGRMAGAGRRLSR